MFSYLCTLDFDSRTDLAWQPTTIFNGTRSSSAYAYLAPEYASRPNLHVVVNHRAIQLLETTTNDSSVPDVRTVVFRSNNSSKCTTNDVLAFF